MPERTTASDLRVVWLLVVATFVLFLNETTMSVALKPIMSDLGIEARTGQWLSTAFMLTMAMVIPVTGYLIERLHTRTLYITSMSSFTIGTLAAAFAPGFPVLLIARVVQACGTAIMLPLLMTTVMTVVAEDQRGRMMGNLSVVMSVAPALGPTLSGVLLDTVGWRGIFVTMLPLALVMFAVGYRWMRNVTEPVEIPIDVLSVVLSALGFGFFVYGLSLVGGDSAGDSGSASGSGDHAGFMLPATLGGLVLLGLFVWRQIVLQRTDKALLDLRTFRSGQFALAVSLMVLLMASLFGIVILLPIYLQTVLAMEPIYVGLMLLPGGLAMGLLGPAVGRAYDRYGPRPLAVPGALGTTAAMTMFALVGESTSWVYLLIAHILLSVSLSMLFTPLFTGGLAAVEPRMYSHASAIMSTVQQVSGAAGTALFVTVLSTRSGTLRGEGHDLVSATAGGVRTAFIGAAALTVIPLVASFFVRRPAARPELDAEAVSPRDPDEQPELVHVGGEA